MKVAIIIEPYADLRDDESEMGLTEDGCHDLYEVARHVGNVIAFRKVDEEELV